MAMLLPDRWTLVKAEPVSTTAPTQNVCMKIYVQDSDLTADALWFDRAMVAVLDGAGPSDWTPGETGRPDEKYHWTQTTGREWEHRFVLFPSFESMHVEQASGDHFVATWKADADNYAQLYWDVGESKWTLCRTVGGAAQTAVQGPAGAFLPETPIRVTARSIAGSFEVTILDGAAPVVLTDEAMPALNDAVVTMGFGDESFHNVLSGAYADSRVRSIADLTGLDFDGDAVVTSDDVNLLYAMLDTTVPPTDPMYDLTGDGEITMADAHQMVEGMLATSMADTNLDWAVDVLDLGNLANRYGRTGTFSDGDTNGDGRIDILDLGNLAGDFGKEFYLPMGP